MVIEVARAKKQGFKTDSRACISLNHMRKPMIAQSDKEHLYQGNMKHESVNDSCYSLIKGLSENGKLGITLR